MSPARSRVELTPLARADRDEFLATARASRRLHRPWVSPPTTVQAFDELLARVARHESSYLLLRRRQDGAIAGYFHVSQIVRRSYQSAFLGYAGAAGLVGQGYMSEGMQLLLRHAFGELRLHRLEANIQPANAASIALARRAGFVREGFSERYLKVGGVWRDHERWAIRAEQWRALRRAQTNVSST
jgi:[ribosomal protein S5]-alanine N-acetyltransferase